MNLYIDAFDFAQNPSGLEFASLIGTNTRFMSVQNALASSLALPATGYGSLTVALNPFDSIYIFDGPNSEVVQVSTAGAGAGATSIPLVNPLAFTHQAGVDWCSDGVDGSLGEQIVSACALLENKCKQVLMQNTYTSEILRMPSMRASIDNQGAFNFRPRHFPVQALTSLEIQTIQQQALSYDVSQAFIDGDRQEISMPALIPLTPGGGVQSSPYYQTAPVQRKSNAWATLTYIAGYAWPDAIPGDIVEAACLLVGDILGKRENPTGADQIRLGEKLIQSAIRGDMTGESVLVKRANGILAYYTVQSY